MKKVLTDVTTIHLLGVRVFVGHDFGRLSPLPSCIGLFYQGNYKTRDNIFGAIVGKVEACLGSLYVPPMSVNGLTAYIHSYHI